MGGLDKDSDVSESEQRCQVQLGECGRYGFISEHNRPDGTVCYVEHDKRDTTAMGMMRLQQFATRQFVIDPSDQRNREQPRSTLHGTCSHCGARLFAVLGEDIFST